MENNTQRPLTQQNRECGSSALFPLDEDNLIWNMFPTVTALNGLEKTAITSHILAKGSAGEVGQSGNPKADQKSRMENRGKAPIRRQV